MRILIAVIVVVILTIIIGKSLLLLSVRIFTLPAGAVAKYCNEHVCLCVCVHEHISQPHARSLPMFLCMLPIAMAWFFSPVV